MTNTIQSIQTKEVPAEILASIRFRIVGFELSKVEIDTAALASSENTIFFTTPTFHFDPQEKKVSTFLNINCYRSQEDRDADKNRIASFESILTFGVIGMFEPTDIEGVSNFVFPVVVLRSFLNTAIGTMRGAIFQASAGKVLLPILDVSKFNLDQPAFEKEGGLSERPSSIGS